MRTVQSWTCELGYGADTMFHRTYFLYFYHFVSFSYAEKPAMGSQPNFASRSEVVSIYKCPHTFWGFSLRFGTPKITFWTTFFATSALDTSYRRNKTSHRQTKRKCQSTMCPLKVNLLSGIFDQETAEIRWRIVTHHIKVQHFLSLPHFPHKNH